ncbi:MAG: MotA/TolQ/ExbB proton channel family protein [Kangiellaceae bacterium]|nr:MotA/TolQ/ExbB proton channel family protein [Kangiellaceae bacterium]
MNKAILATVLATTFSFSFAAENQVQSVQQADTLEKLLDMVKQAERAETRENQQRLQRFQAQKNQQQRLLNEAKAELARQEKRSDQLKNEFDTNEKTLGEMSESLRIKLGNLGEAVGVVRQTAADAASSVSNSVVSAQYPGRHDILRELAARKEIPTIPELRQLWIELQTEMSQQGKIVKFNADLLDKNGTPANKPIIRVGAFNLVANGEYINYNRATNNTEEIAKQPAGFSDMIANYEASSGVALFPIDPSQGAIVNTEKDRETWGERFTKYAGIVGYAIVVVLVIGLLITLERFFTLSSVGGKMRKQAKSSTPGKNPLGRVMAVYMANKDDSLENLELKLDEAVLKELPALEARIGIIKIFAAVSPLMGLLGTVTGMIETFQGITLYGAGDTSVMAGGISSALITTVLGIVAAIPLILAHAFVSSKSKGLVHVLEEQSSGLIAQHIEGK